MAVYGLLAVAGEAGTTSYLVREIARDPDSHRPVRRQPLAARLAAGVVLTVGALLVVPQLGYGTELEHATQIAVLALWRRRSTPSRRRRSWRMAGWSSRP